MQCNIRPEHVISAPDISSIYDVPLNFDKDNIADIILPHLNLKKKKSNKLAKDGMRKWRAFANKAKNVKKEVNIAIVGKYFGSGDFVLSDVYISVIEAIRFSAYSQNVKPILHWVSSQDFESGKLSTSELKKYDGIIVPGGFGQTGIEGKIKVIKYVRENKIPYFGLCYGMQLMVVEYARHKASLAGANTREIDNKAEHLVIDIMPEQKDKIKNKEYGGTMRLGQYPAYLKKGTIARKAYKEELINERHRHRYEVNSEYVDTLEDAGIIFSGVSPDKRLMEIAELNESEHPFMLGTQFHPELQARPLSPHPLFTAFIKVAINKHK
jgi:CTP synthase